jgi:hypothetical protein
MALAWTAVIERLICLPTMPLGQYRSQPAVKARVLAGHPLDDVE